MVLGEEVCFPHIKAPIAFVTVNLNFTSFFQRLERKVNMNVIINDGEISSGAVKGIAQLCWWDLGQFESQHPCRKFAPKVLSRSVTSYRRTRDVF